MNNKGTILVVDDTLASLKLLTDLLTAEGYAVHPANSGELALASAAAYPPDLILLDIRMPVMDGFEVFRRLKTRPISRSIPVIFLSAISDCEQQVEGLKLGAVDFVSKPFKQEELLARVQTHLELSLLRTSLKQHEERLNSIFEAMSEGFSVQEVICDDTGKPCDLRFVEVNPAFERQTGLKSEDTLGHTLLELFPQSESFWIERYGKVGLTGEPAHFEANFGPLNKVYQVNAFQIELGRLGVLYTDITELKQAEEEILSLSLTDELTGLYNRRGFTLLAEQEVKLAHRIKRTMLLFFGDMDNLKAINDTLGHAHGDLALKRISAILKETFREADILARIGGDEFVVLAVDASVENAEIMTNRLQNALDAHNQQRGETHLLSLSLGVASYDPEDPCTVSELIARADSLMYNQKQSRKERSMDQLPLRVG